ncbi:MAG: hypothetical protein PHI71_01475 [Acidiphilium sp.]|nr:hypothetical protein [Acidiphilium sp.]
MTDESAPQELSRGRRVLDWLGYGVSIIATGKPPITADERRQNRETFMRQTRKLTEIALLITLIWVLAVVTAAWLFPPALHLVLGWGGCMVAFVGFLKISQIVLNRRCLQR